MIDFSDELKAQMKPVSRLSRKSRRMLWHLAGIGLLSAIVGGCIALGIEHLLKECSLDLLLEESARFIYEHCIVSEG